MENQSKHTKRVVCPLYYILIVQSFCFFVVYFEISKSFALIYNHIVLHSQWTVEPVILFDFYVASFFFWSIEFWMASFTSDLCWINRRTESQKRRENENRHRISMKTRRCRRLWPRAAENGLQKTQIERDRMERKKLNIRVYYDYRSIKCHDRLISITLQINLHAVQTNKVVIERIYGARGYKR